jgi:hypothetical protein
MKLILIAFLVFCDVAHGQSSENKFDELTKKIKEQQEVNSEECYRLLQVQKTLAEKGENNDQIARNFLNYAKYWDNNLSQNDSSYFYLLRAKKFFQKNRDKEQIGKTYLRIAILHHKEGRDDRAEKASDEAYKIGEKLKDKILLGDISFERSKIFFWKENISKA